MMNGKEGNNIKMHELFMQVLKNRDLSRAGDLFSVADTDIVHDLTQVVSFLRLIMQFVPTVSSVFYYYFLVK